MRGKTKSLFRLSGPVYTRGSRLLIQSGELTQRSQRDTLSCVLQLKALAELSLQSVTVCLSWYDAENLPLGEDSYFSYPAAALQRDAVFGDRLPIPVPDAGARSFSVYVSAMETSDGESVFFSSDDVIALPRQQTLEEVLGSEDMAEQIRVRYGSDCHYMRADAGDLWFCICGGVNFREEQVCHRCRRSVKALTALNLDSLRAEAGSRVRSEADRAAQEKAAARKATRSRLKWMLLLIPVVVLVVLLAATVPGAVQRERQYREAVELLEAGKLDEAESAFRLLPGYRDSEEMITGRIPYLRAHEIYDAAENGDLNMLTAAGHQRSEITEDTTAVMLLYDGAAKAFDALDGYEDSGELAAAARKGIERELTRLTQEDYDAAAALLESGHYSDAIKAFQALDGFSDSEEMILRCRYEKAVSLFGFLSAYDVSRIRASISFDPGEASVYFIPKSVALNLGSDCVAALRSANGGASEPIDVLLEEETPPDGLEPLKDALKQVFEDLDDYQDSADYPARIDDATDYTKEFYALCEDGDLYEAMEWLQSYDGDFAEREKWSGLLMMYLPYCRSWSLFLGDAALLSYTVGQYFSSDIIDSRVLLTDGQAILRLSFGPGGIFAFDLPAAQGEFAFINRDLDSGNYVATINQVGHLIYTRYDGDFNAMSSCEYSPEDYSFSPEDLLPEGVELTDFLPEGFALPS